MWHSNGLPESLGRVFGTAVLALAVFGLTSCSDDPTRPADPVAFEVHADVQQALVPGSLTEIKLTASDGAAFDLFGNSVAVSGDVAVIGARGDGDHGSNSGSAYVFESAGGPWVESAKLTASDGAGGDWFGISVAVSGDVAVIGADRDEDNGTSSGSAYVFERVGGAWAQVQKLTASDGAAFHQFGRSVAVSGNVAVIGAFGDDHQGNNTGSAYVFERVGGAWVQGQKLTANDGAFFDRFGISVAVSGDVAVIGALGDADHGAFTGSAYVFERVGGAWVQAQKLTASDGAAFDFFGISVAVSGDVAVIGAFRDEHNGSASGSAYVFHRVGGIWGETAKLTASDGAASHQFGTSVAVSGDVAVIGADGDDHSGSWSGSAYVFERAGTAWTEVEKLTASEGASGDFFGGSVAVSDDAIIIGAERDDDNGSNSGSAYIFESSVSVLPVAIDIKPGSDENPVSLRGTNRGRGQAGGSLPVAVLTTATGDGDEFDFDATTADPATLTLGDDDGNETPVAQRRNGTLRASVEDVDGDGDDDLLLHFEQGALVGNGDLVENTAELVLNGETVDGTAISGADAVRIVGSP